MHPHKFIAIAWLLAAAALLHPAHSETVSRVEATKDRCVRRLDRAEHDLECAETALGHVEELAAGSHGPQTESARNRIDYFRSRIERVRNQVDKIETSLADAGTGMCPNCIASEARLMCRQVESIENELARFTADTRRAEQDARRAGSAEAVVSRAEVRAAGLRESDGDDAARIRASLERARAALGSGNDDEAMRQGLEALDLMAAAAPRAETVEQILARLERLAGQTGRALEGRPADDPGRLLLAKGEEQIAEARRLTAQGEVDQARRRLDIADRLITKADAAVQTAK